jgi:hypothetical protein
MDLDNKVIGKPILFWLAHKNPTIAGAKIIPLYEDIISRVETNDCKLATCFIFSNGGRESYRLVRLRVEILE